MIAKLFCSLTISLAGFALASCISVGASWVQDGVTREQFAVDKENCRGYAQRQAEDPHVNTDVIRSEGRINTAFSYNELMRQHSAQKDAKNFFESCLIRHGYKKVDTMKKGKKS